MLTLIELKELLSQNEALLWAELNSDCPNRRRSDMRRLLELQLHRIEIFKCIIIEQEKIIKSQNETRKVA